ncbi:hypothetical protein DYH09_04300 [bacterium CPR1]|nr:hypothetical protein [bacterium CPR1]
MSHTLRIVNYAVNGAGVGHLARLVAVNRWVRRYAAFAGARAEIYFLTSSEADGLLFQERFASFKLPSKTVVGETGIDKLTYLALAKQWVWHSLGLIRPDLLVVDTFPRGSFGELLSALDLCRQRAFIYRPVKPELAQKPDFAAMLPLYDAILVPEPPGTKLPMPEGVKSRTRFFGPVAVREPHEMLLREEARKRLGIPEGKLALYCSAGGGGDEQAEATLTWLCDELASYPRFHLVVAAGPLYRGRSIHASHVTWLRDWGSATYLPGCDLALTAAGYNTCAELWLAGLPAVFLPQPKIADQQAERARRAVEAGAGSLLAELTPAALQDALEPYLDPEHRQRASLAARGLVPRNHARDMAAALLKLVLPPRRVDAAEDALTDSLLQRATRRGLELDDVARLVHALGEPEAKLARPACSLLELMQRHQLPTEAGLRLAQAFCRKLERAGGSERARALKRILPELAAFGNWNAAATLVRVLGTERELGAEELAERLADCLSGARERGHDLYQVVARISEAQEVGSAQSKLAGNAEVLRRAHQSACPA